MKILVTGSAGFVGRNLVENLKAFEMERTGQDQIFPSMLFTNMIVTIRWKNVSAKY